jgi:hypothetical protein
MIIPARFTCPSCGSGTRDKIAAQLGMCERCKAFTGLCAGGRTIGRVEGVSPEWQIPCAERGEILWRFTREDQTVLTVLLCASHDQGVRGGPLVAALQPGQLWQRGDPVTGEHFCDDRRHRSRRPGDARRS